MTGPGPAAPPWWALLPPADAQVSCGAGAHRLRWADGKLTTPDHPDAEGELVLAALGGDRSRCVDLVESWGRRGDDLEVLAVGPRSADDELMLPAQTRDAPGVLGIGGVGGWVAYAPLSGRTFSAPRLPSPARGPRPATARPSPRRQMAARVLGRSTGVMRALGQQLPDKANRAAERREELFALLALGPGFQLRLCATVAAAWADGGSRAAGRDRAKPALVAALAGRLAPAAQAWLGIDPGRVDVSLHEEAGWGRLELCGDRLAAALPVGWLASVWAAGLSVIAGHLVVAITEAAWPEATVLAVPGPGANPVILGVRAAEAGWVVERT